MYVAIISLPCCVRLFETPWTAALQASLSFTISRSLLKLMSIESVMPSNHLILCRPLLLRSIFPSFRVFSNESTLRIRWPKYWRCSFSPSSEYSGLISLRIDRCDLLVSSREGRSSCRLARACCWLLEAPGSAGAAPLRTAHRGHLELRCQVSPLPSENSGPKCWVRGLLYTASFEQIKQD